MRNLRKSKLPRDLLNRAIKAEFPQVLVVRWKVRGRWRKEFWWLIDDRRGIYLDAYTKLFYGDGEGREYDQLRSSESTVLPNRRERAALNRGNLAAAYRVP